jgi:transposase
MSKARLVITAVTVEKRPVAEVVRDYGVARSWVYELLARYRDEGEAAFAPRSRRPQPPRARHRPRRSSWSYGCANSSATPAWTPAPTPSAGT